MIDIFYLRDNTCHVLLINTMIFFMMIIWLNKHMYDVMIILIMPFLWIKLNVNLSKFLTKAHVKRPGPVPLCQVGQGFEVFLAYVRRSSLSQ
jgi:hypothetical protein